MRLNRHVTFNYTSLDAQFIACVRMSILVFFFVHFFTDKSRIRDRIVSGIGQVSIRHRVTHTIICNNKIERMIFESILQSKNSSYFFCFGFRSLFFLWHRNLICQMPTCIARQGAKRRFVWSAHLRFRSDFSSLEHNRMDDKEHWRKWRWATVMMMTMKMEEKQMKRKEKKLKEIFCERTHYNKPCAIFKWNEV